MLRPKSAKRTWVIELIYGSRADKQFDKVFWVFSTLLGPIGHSESLIFNCDCVNNFHVWKPVDANARPQGHRHLFVRPPGIFCCAKAPGRGAHFGAKAPGGMVTGQSDTCIRTHKTSILFSHTIRIFTCTCHERQLSSNLENIFCNSSMRTFTTAAFCLIWCGHRCFFPDMVVTSCRMK